MALTAKLFHLGAVGFYLYVSYFLLNIDKSDPNNTQKRKVVQYTFRFLTNWTYGMQLLYYTCCVIVHFLEIIPPLRKIREKVNSFGNGLFTTIAAPVGFMVTLAFWSIYLVDRELVYPKYLDQIIPYWINHALHTLNSLLVILDMCLVNHKFPTFGFAVKIILGYLGIYSICLFGTYFHEGIWIYPFLNELTWPQRTIFFLVNLFVTLLLFLLTKVFNGFLWGGRVATTKPTKSKKSGKQKSKKSA